MSDLAHASEGDTDLIGDTNAVHWAERFAHSFVACKPAQDGLVQADNTEDLMLGWFASAIESGKMHSRHVADLGLRSAVFQALGEASMSWSETPAGEFDSTRSSAIGEKLLTVIQRWADCYRADVPEEAPGG
jgi:hypothetical protein